MPYSLTHMSNALTWTFLAALVAASVTRLWLALRQIRHVRAHRGAVPRTFAEAIPLAAHQKAADYTVAKARLGLVGLFVGTLLVLGLTFGGGIQRARKRRSWQIELPHIGDALEGTCCARKANACASTVASSWTDAFTLATSPLLP